MRRTQPKQVVYFSVAERSPVIEAHLATGGTAYTLTGNTLVESTGNQHRILASADHFACTMRGTARFQVANLLAAIAACRAFGIGVESIVSALADFGGIQKNSGRVNLYSVNGGYVLVDYGHNVGAFQAICDMTRTWSGLESIGVVSLPGDRADRLLQQAARVAGCGFHRLVIREDNDRRGRDVGTIAEQFYKTVKMHSPALDVTVIIDEAEAYRYGLQLAGPGRLVVLFYDDYDLVQRALDEAGAVSAEFRSEILQPLDRSWEGAAS